MSDMNGKIPFFVSKTNPMTITGLQSNTSYNFQLVVYDNNENSTVWENPITFKTLPTVPILTNFKLQLIKPTSEFVKCTFKATTTDKIVKANLNINNIDKNFDFALNSKIESMNYDHETYPYYCLIYINDENIQTTNRYKLCISKHELKFVQFKTQQNYNVKLTYDDEENFYVVESNSIDGLLTQTPSSTMASIEVYSNHNTTYMLSPPQYKFDYFSSNYDTNFFNDTSEIATRIYYNYCSIDEEGNGILYIYNLSPKTVYEMSLSVFDSYNQSATDGPLTIITKDIPPIITNVIKESIQQHEITFLIECETTVGIKTYSYSYNSESITTPSNPYTITNLDIFTDYAFTITVTDINGQTDTVIENVKTSGTGPQISELSVSNITDTSAVATVDVTSQNTIDKYVWSCNDKVYQTETNTITINNLTPYTNYAINVIVYDVNKNYDSEDATFLTKSNGINVDNCIISNISYTSFDIELESQQDVPVKNLEIQLTNVEEPTDIQTFAGFLNLDFTVENIYPNKTYNLKITITDIDNIVTTYNYSSTIVMKSSTTQITSIDVSNLTNSSLVAKVIYQSDIQVDNIKLLVNKTTGEQIFEKTQSYTNNIFNVTGLITETEYIITATIMFDKFPDENKSITKNITTMPNPVYIYFDTDGGNNIPTLQKYKNDVINLNDYIPSKLGYTFQGWYIGDTKYQDNYTVGIEDVTFTAHWKIRYFDVTFIYYGENATYENKNLQTVTQQVPFNTSATAPELPDTSLTYNFVSWDKDFSFVLDNITVTAEYTGVEYFISFQSEFGTIEGLNEDDVLVYNYGEPIGTLPTLIGISKDFEGWSTVPNDPDSIVTTETIWTFTDVDILYAIFEMYKLSYNYGDGIGYNSIQLLNANGFSYYNTSGNSGTIDIVDNSTITLNTISGTQHVLRSILSISAPINGMICYGYVDNNATIEVKVTNNSIDNVYEIQKLIPYANSQNVYLELIINIPSSPGIYNIRDIYVAGLYEQSPEYQYKAIGEQIGTLPITWSSNQQLIGHWYDDEYGNVEVTQNTIFNEDTMIYSLYQLREKKSFLLSGNEFNTKLRSLSSSVVSTIFSKNKIDDSKIEDAIVVSMPNSPYKSYAYLDGTTLYICPEADNIPIFTNEDCAYMFNYFTSLSSISFDNINTSSTRIFSGMFGYSGLTSIDLSLFDTKNAVSMNRMFYSCYKLQNVNLSMLNTQNVTTMEKMFYDNRMLQSVNLSNIACGKIQNLNSMFHGCTKLSTVQFFNSKLSSLNDIDAMFALCSSLENLDLTYLDTTNVTTYNYTFRGCSKLNSSIIIKNSEVTSYTDVFYDCSTNVRTQFIVSYINASTKLIAEQMVATKSPTGNVILDNSQKTSILISGPEFNTKLKSLGSSFNSLTFTKTAIPIEKIETAQNVSNSEYAIFMYLDNNTVYISPELENTIIKANADCSNMFNGCGNLNNINVTNLNTSSVENMSGMFGGTGSSTTYTITGLSSWNTSRVKNMKSMFSYTAITANSCNIGDISNWDTSSVNNMSYMFKSFGESCSNLNISNLNTWITSNVTDMNHMFESMGYSSTNCNIGDLTNWDTSNVEDMSYMFSNCVSLSSAITIKNHNIISYANMFTGCSTASSKEFIVKYSDDITKSIAIKMVETKSENSNVFLEGTKDGGNNVS